MKPANVLLVILIVLFSVLGCSPQKIQVQERQLYERCQRPLNQEFILLTDEHLASPRNAASIMINVSNLVNYIKLQNATINCYERQAK